MAMYHFTPESLDAFSSCSWSQWRGSWRCLKPSSYLCCFVCLCHGERKPMLARRVSSTVSSTFSWKQLIAKQESAPPGTGRAEAAVHRSQQPRAVWLRAPTWDSLKANEPSRDAAVQLPLLPQRAVRLKNNKHGPVKSRPSFLLTCVWRTEPTTGLQGILFFLISSLSFQSLGARGRMGRMFVRIKQEGTMRKGGWG